MARKFTTDAITPDAAEWDEEYIFAREVIKQSANLGFEGNARSRARMARAPDQYGSDGLRMSCDQKIDFHPEKGKLDDCLLLVADRERQISFRLDPDGEGF